MAALELGAPSAGTFSSNASRAAPAFVAGHPLARAPAPAVAVVPRAGPKQGDGDNATTRWGLPAGLVTMAAMLQRRRLHRPRAAKKRVRCAAVAASGNSAAAAPPVTKGYFSPRATPLLDSMNNEGTAGMKGMTVPQLKELAEEVRWQVLDAVSVSGGHLGAGLGVTDLTVALHHVFDTPRDEICWDVAHQCQPHKVLTGRRDRIYTLRQGGGLSGFAKRAESVYDAFGAGHSTTSISAAVGFNTAREVLRKRGHSVAVIGDGAITGGMAWEAINHAGGMNSKIIVVLNDNGQVSLPTFYNNVEKAVGALSKTLSGEQHDAMGLRIQGDIARMETSSVFQGTRQRLKAITKQFPEQVQYAAAKLDEYSRDFLKTVPFRGSGAGSKGELFEQLGFYYLGPIDGHDMGTLVDVLSNIKRDHDSGVLAKPVLLHIKTQKGKGYGPAERASDKLHAVMPKFNLAYPDLMDAAPAKEPAPAPAAPAKPEPKKPKPEPLTKVFADALVREAEADEKIVAITAAMPGGTGIGIFEKRFGPTRTFDVGIAEQHAVTFAAGLAGGGLKPFCSIYSTFLQRAYDQVVHDVALQNLPVRFIIDRAGLVGADGPTHGGTFDLSYLGCVPNMLICASADEAELVSMVHTIAKIDDYPTALRYPRGNSKAPMDGLPAARFLEPGKGRIVREGRDNTLAILSIGDRLRECLKAAERLETCGISVTVADARWMKPLDQKLLGWLASSHRAMITVEENSIGGFSAQVQQSLLENGFLDSTSKESVILRSMMFPDRWINHDTPELQYDDAELNAKHIFAKALTVLGSAGVKVNLKAGEPSLQRPTLASVRQAEPVSA